MTLPIDQPGSPENSAKIELASVTVTHKATDYIKDEPDSHRGDANEHVKEPKDVTVVQDNEGSGSVDRGAVLDEKCLEASVGKVVSPENDLEHLNNEKNTVEININAENKGRAYSLGGEVDEDYEYQ